MFKSRRSNAATVLDRGIRKKKRKEVEDGLQSRLRDDAAASDGYDVKGVEGVKRGGSSNSFWNNGEGRFGGGEGRFLLPMDDRRVLHLDDDDEGDEDEGEDEEGEDEDEDEGEEGEDGETARVLLVDAPISASFSK